MEKKKFICEICGKEYLSHTALRTHKLNKHPDVYKKKTTNIICDFCNKPFDTITKYIIHLQKEHNIVKNSFEYIYYKEKANNKTFSGWGVIIPLDITLNLLKKLNEYNNCENLYVYQFISFYKMITSVREYIIEEDNNNYINNVLPWKLAHSKQGNSIELCQIVFPNEPENAELLYKRYMYDKNPFVGHGGELSPYSRDFVGYKDLSEDEKMMKIRENLKCDSDSKATNQIGYWLKRGLSENDAIKMVHERQQTFSKEKCIVKYGYEEGMRIWKDRQEKWQNTLKSKPEEEQIRILKAKIENSKVQKPYSKIEHEFSSRLVSEEFMNVAITPYAVPDICIGNKIIEFYGDYYHCNPKIYSDDYINLSSHKTAKEIWDADEKRINRLKEDGFVVKIVWESEYKANKQLVINECKLFLES